MEWYLNNDSTLLISYISRFQVQRTKEANRSVIPVAEEKKTLRTVNMIDTK